MYTSVGLAKKYGLERYLEQPRELNAVIFNLMLLQETIQLEQARKKKRDDSQAELMSVKRHATGKFIAGCSGEISYRYAVETALKESTALLAVFHRSRFISVLTKMGVPEEKISEFCRTVTLDDDTHCIDQE
jgi:hypothetical protein